MNSLHPMNPSAPSVFSALAAHTSLSRRAFLQNTATALSTSLLAPPLLAATGTPSSAPKSETLAAQLFHSLTAEQRKKLCFPFDDPLRSKVDNNWQITVPQTRILSPDQQDLVRQIFVALHSPDYAQRVLDQVIHDSEGEGFSAGTSIALFGEPKSQGFELVLTGRHCTRRCDGDSVSGSAFGGPIFYGHAAGAFREAPTHPGNAYWYQAQRANELFAMLDGKQRDSALVDQLRPEKSTQTVQLRGRTGPKIGLPIEALSADQKSMMRRVLGDVLAPFRKEDVDESLRLIEPQFEQLHIAFSKSMDLGNDGIWDVWQIEGPSLLWLFRGAPHVHVWVHLRDPALVS